MTPDDGAEPARSARVRALALIRRVAGSAELRASVVYLGGNVIAAVFPLLMLPIFTRWLAPEEYGTYALALVIVQFLFPLASLGLANAVARDFVDRDKLDFERVVSISLVLSGVVVVALAILAIVGQMFGLENLLGTGEMSPLLFVVAVIIMLAAQVVISIAMSLQQMEERPVLYSMFRIGSQLIFALFSLVALVWLDAGLNGVILAKALTDGVTIVACLIFLACRGYLVPRFEYAEARRILAYGLPLVPHMVSVSLIAIIDRTMLSQMVGLDATGVFMAGYQIGMVMWLIVSSTNAAWVPWFYKQMAQDTPAAKWRIVRAIYGVGAGYVVLGVGLALLVPLLVTVLSGPSYHDAAPVAALVVVAFTFQGCYALFSSFLYYQKRTKTLSIATGITLLVNLLASFIAIRALGIVGAAVGTLVAYFVSFVAVATFAILRTDLPWTGRLLQAHRVLHTRDDET